MGVILALLLCVQDEEKKKPKQEPEVEVTSTRLDLPVKETPFSTSSVDGARIQAEHADSTVELLRGLPGLTIRRTGVGRNGIVSLFTRGTNSNHTLVLADGFQITRDGAQFFEYDLFSPYNLDRIEATRGAASAVYGSDAVGGVINLISRRGQGPATLRVAAEGGTFTTSRGTMELYGGTADGGYSLAVSRLEQADGPLDHSDYDALSFAGRFDFRLSERTSVKVVTRYFSGDQEVPTNGAPEVTPLDANHTREDDMMLLGAEFTHWAADWIELTARLSRLETERLNNDPGDPPGAGDFNQHLLFDRSAAEGLVSFHLGAWGILTLGSEYEIEESEESNNFAPGLSSDEDRYNRAYFAQWSWALGGFRFIPGLRWEDNENFGGDLNGRLAASYLFADAGTKLRAAWGTGITTPRLDQLFGFGGDPKLQPEESVSWDAGVDQWLFNDGLRVSLTYFETRLQDLILFQGFLGPYFNGGDGVTRGLEAEMEMKVFDSGVLGASYTFLRTRATDIDEPASAPTLEKHEEFIRRPTHSGRVYAGWHVPDAYGIFVDVSVLGSAEDSTFTPFPGTREKNDGFIKTDVSAFIVIAKGLRAWARVDNAFDVHYHEILGFDAPHASFLAGLEYALGL